MNENVIAALRSGHEREVGVPGHPTEVDPSRGALYPDDGCTFEIYTSSQFYEIETLSPLYCLKPGVSYSHREEWWAGYEKINTQTIQSVKSFVNELF